ncbi:MAG: stalk domain-containing protein [Caldisericales bacterium]
MRKIVSILIAIVISMFFVLNPTGAGKTASLSEKYFNTRDRYFDIVAYGYDGPQKIEYKEPSPLFRYYEGAITFFEFEIKDQDGTNIVAPKFDENGNPIKIKQNDPKIIEKILLCLSPMINAKIGNNSKNFKEVALGIFLGDRGWEYIRYSLDFPENHYFNRAGSMRDKIYPYGTFSIVDNDFNFEVYEYYGVMHQRTRAEAFNPDLCNIHEYPGLDGMAEISYSRYDFGQGYLQTGYGPGKYCLAGQQREWAENALTSRREMSGEMLIDIRFLSEVLFSPMIYNDSKSCTIKRLCQLKSSEIELVELKFTADSKKVLVNGVEKDLSEAPTIINDRLYVPVADACKFLKANCHIRGTDGAVLIARFFAPMRE